MIAIVCLSVGVLFALVFKVISLKKFNLITTIAIDLLLGFIPPIATYFIAFLITQGNVPHYTIALFLLAFVVSLCFLFPIKKEKRSK